MSDSVIQLGEEDIDLAPALPLLLRDWLALEDQGVTMETMQGASLKVMHALARYVIKKADSNANLDLVLDFTMTQLKDLFSIIKAAEDAPIPNRPSTTSSTT